MANVKMGLSKKSTVIILILIFLLVGGGGGYLLWRVNQKETVAPTDSDAGSWSCSPVYDVTYYLRNGTEKNAEHVHLIQKNLLVKVVQQLVSIDMNVGDIAFMMVVEKKLVTILATYLSLL